MPRRIVILVIIFGAIIGFLYDTYTYLTRDYNTQTLRMDISWNSAEVTEENAPVYWTGIRGDTVVSDYVSTTGNGIRHESRLYHRELWISAELIPRIQHVTLCVGDRCQTIDNSRLSSSNVQDLRVADGGEEVVEAVRIESAELRRESLIPYFDGIMNWRGDRYLVVADLQSFLYQLVSLAGFVGLVLFVFSGRSTDVREVTLPKPEMVWALLVAIFLLAMVLRFSGLGNLDPHIDEYAHLQAALELMEGGAPDYERGIIVTLVVAAAYAVSGAAGFSELLVVGAVPGILASSLVVFPLYLLGRRVSTITGLLAAFLWALSPWAIGLSHWLREYAYFPLLIVIFILSTVRIFELVFVHSRFQKWPFLLWALVFAVFTWYAFVIDTASTLRAGFLFSGLFGVGLVAENWKNILVLLKRYPKVLIGALVPAIILCYIVISLATGDSQVSLLPQSPDWWWVSVLFSDGAPLQWWNGPSEFFWPAVYVLIPAVIVAWRDKTPHVATWLLTFIGVLAFYVLFFDRYNNARYMFYILPILCLVSAASLHAVWTFALKWPHRRHRLLLLFCVGAFSLQLVNPTNTWTAVTSTEHGYTFTGNFQPRVRGVLCFLDERIKDGTIVIQTQLGTPLSLSDIIDSSHVYGYSSRSKDRFDRVTSLVNENPEHGYLILDIQRGGGWAEGFPVDRDFELDDVQVHTLGQLDQFYVYTWGTQTESKTDLQQAMRECANNYTSPQELD